MRDRLQAGHPQIARLPAALLETNALLGHRRDLTSNQDRPLPNSQIHLDDTRRVLVVRTECQGCAE